MADGESELSILGEVLMPVCVHSTRFTSSLIVADIDVDGIWGMDFLAKFKCDIKLSNGTFVFDGNDYPLNVEKHDVLPHAVKLTKDLTLEPGMEVAVSANLCSPFRHKQEVTLEPSVFFLQTHGILPAKSVTVQSKRQKTTPVQLFNPSEESVCVRKDTIIGYAFPTAVAPAESTSFQSTSMTTEEHQPNCEQLDDEQLLEELEDAMPSHLITLYNKSSESLEVDQKIKLASVLIKFAGSFSSSSTDIGLTDIISHEINTGNSPPFRLPLRRQGLQKEEQIKAAVEDGLSRGVMEESSSPWASPPVVVAKKDGTSRFCIDFRKLNSVTKIDRYPLPKFDDCIDSLHGSRFFCSLDLQSGYWQVPLKTSRDREKTAFLTKQGLFQFTVLPFGLCNAPATFERLMENVLRHLQWEKCLLYLDDILIYGRTFDETLHNLELVLERLKKANLKMKPKKCSLMQTSLEFLGHIVSENGLAPLPSKLDAVRDWPSLSTVPRAKLRTAVKSFLGLVSYYRRFIRNMSQIAYPLYELTKKTSTLVWTDQCEASFMRLKAALTSAPVLSFPDVQGSDFILDTDASNTGIGAVLSQVQDGEEKVIGFFSKLLSDSERNYCITKREFLAVIRAVEHFKPYLYGQHFLVRTDNAAVSHLLTLSGCNPQIQRWQLFLSSFKFDLVHRPGHKHTNADSMSRMPCLQCGRKCSAQESKTRSKGKPIHFRRKVVDSEVEPCQHTADTDASLEDKVDDLMMSCSVLTRSQTRNLMDNSTSDTGIPDHHSGDNNTTSDIGNLQLSDPDISPILQLKMAGAEYPTFRSISAESLSVKALRQHWRNLFVRNGILYRKLVVPDKDLKVQVVLPRCLKSQILQQLHCDPSAGHLGTFKTLERVKNRFYWIGWRRDTMRFVSHCHTCNVAKHPHKRKKPPLTQQLFGEAFERVSIDLIGPLKRTPRGYQYVVTMEDNFTKWVEAAPLRTMETGEVCDAVIKEFVSRFGCMHILHSDRGPQFISEIYTTLLRKLGIDKSLTTPYNPKSNGLIENFNKILKSIMKTYVEDHHESTGNWDSMLPIFLMAYRSSVHSSTGESPHFMLTSREMKLPLDLLYATPSDAVTDVPTYVKDLQDRFHKAFALVRDRLKTAQRIQKKQYEVSSPKYRSLKEGDFVYYFNPRKTFKGDKHRPWLGPYLVKRLDEDFTVLLQIDASGRTMRTHADKLRKAPASSFQ